MNLAALSSPNFRTYLVGSTFGLQAVWMQRVTIGWLAWDMTASSSFVGLIATMMFAPAIVLSPLFGVLVDRLDVKRAAMTVQTVNLGVVLAYFAVYALGWLTPAVMVVLTLASGILMAANHPMRMSMAPRLVPREMIGSVVTIVAINFNVARTIGPAIGGLLIGAVGVGPTLLVQAVCLLPLILALSRLEVRARRNVHESTEPFFTALRGGLVIVRANAVIWRAMIFGFVLALVGRGAVEILPPLADGVFGRGPEGLGVILTATGIGAICGGFYKAFAPPQRAGRIPRTAIAAVLFGLLMVSGLGLATTWNAALVMAGAIALTTTLAGISLQTAIQMELDDDMRGRVMSLWAVIFAGGSAIGAGLLGVAADVAGFQAALFWAGAATAGGLAISLGVQAATR